MTATLTAPAPSLTQRLALLARSGGVGALATAVDLVTLAVLTHAVKLAPRAASVVALTLGVAVQFVGNKLLAFRDRSPRWASQARRFLAVEAIAFAANVALFDLALRVAPHAPPVALRVVTTNAVYLGVCLPLWSRIFQPDSEVA